MGDRRDQLLDEVSQTLTDVDRAAGRNVLSFVEEIYLQTHVRIRVSSLPLLGVLAATPMRSTQLAAVLHQSAALTAALVRDLDRKGLLVRVPDESDGRAFILKLSPEGAEIAALVAKARVISLGRTLDGWSTDELEEFMPFLRRFAADAAEYKSFRRVVDNFVRY